jgi:hypothetical protein
LATALRVGTSAIAHDDLDASVVTEPVGEDLGRPVVQQVNGPMPFEVHQERAIATNATAAAQRDVIDAEHPRRGHRLVDHRVQQPQQRIGLVGTPALCANRAPPSPPA